MDDNSPKRILIVDDNPTDVRFMKHVLEKQIPSASFEEAYDAAEFHQKTSKTKYDLIFLDIHLAGETGLEICRTFKEDIRNADTKVVVYSGAINAELFDCAKSAGADCVLSKEQIGEVWQSVVSILLGIQPPARSKKKQILLVDDDRNLLAVLENRVAMLGFSVLTAQTGSEALWKAAEAHPDVILLDIALPGLNGIDVCRRLKQNPATSGIPVIMLTGKTDQDYRNTSIKAGAFAFITKPFDAKELCRRIEEASPS